MTPLQQPLLLSLFLVSSCPCSRPGLLSPDQPSLCSFPVLSARGGLRPSSLYARVRAFFNRHDL